jgi:hypothetical protein
MGKDAERYKKIEKDGERYEKIWKKRAKASIY